MTLIGRAMVLAAGLGTRMRPVTDTRPKPLVEVAGRTLLDHALDRLAAAGVDDAVVNVHYLADSIERRLERRKRPRIVISDERDALLDTGGGVKKALALLGGDPFFTVNTDALWIEGVRPTLPTLAETFDADRMDALLLLAPTIGSIGFSGAGDFLMDPDGRLERRQQVSAAPFVFAGVTVTHPRLLDGAPDGAFSMNLLWDRAIEAGRLYGLRHEGIWMHVGTPEAIGQAEVALTRDFAP